MEYIVTIGSLDQAKEIAVLFFVQNHIGKTCVHCGKVYESPQDVLDAQVIGHGGIPVHGHCYFIHEADDKWRFAHPEYKSE